MTTRQIFLFIALICAATARPIEKLVGRKKLEDQLRDGHSIDVVGMVAEDAKRFDIILSSDEDEKPLVLEFKLDEKKVLLKSFFGGGWDFPEHRRSPVRAGDEFKIEIYVGNNEFLVMVNDFWKATYSNRVDFANIVHVAVTGDAVIEKIEHYQGESGESGEENQEEQEEGSTEDE